MLAVVSDLRRSISTDGTNVDHYEPVIVSAHDYYPFGSLMPGRSWNMGDSLSYRYGFGGQEKSDEIKGEGNSYTAQFWEYDPRIGRRWNLDPKPIPAESEYAVNRNSPILLNDPKGDCPNCIAAGIGAGIGALVGGGIEIGMQLYKEGKVSNWKAVGGSAIQGAATGAAAGFTAGSSLVVTTTAVGVANGVGGAINKAAQGKKSTVGSVATDVAVGAAFGVAGKYFGDKLGQAISKSLPAADEMFTNSIASRGLAERFAQLTKYKGFQNANEVIQKNNAAFDLFDNLGNVVDVTTTSAKKLGTSQFTEKLDALSQLGPQFKNRTLQIYEKEGQYSKEELSTLTNRLQDFIKDFNLKNVNFSIDKVK